MLLLQTGWRESAAGLCAVTAKESLPAETNTRRQKHARVWGLLRGERDPRYGGRAH